MVKRRPGDPDDDRALLIAVACSYRRHLPDSVDFQDLIQAGEIGLIHARRLYDPDRGIKFSTFASKRIRGAMQDWLRQEHKRLQRRKPGEVRPGFTPMSRLREEGRQFRDARAQDETRSLIDQDELEDLLRRLGTKERVAVALYHLHAFTLKRVGIVLAVSESRACQILHRGMAELRAIAAGRRDRFRTGARCPEDPERR